ncbi:hypothetical protein BJ741DRAFT_619772 [Chytriomyces cf. hyalinus JEL632]|nr:hypothetical protein BJ741DRAFT_619772 [Chytriomyces cf. hyalinus JEL632]
MSTSHCHWEDCSDTFSDAQALYDHLTTDHVTKRIGRGNSDGLRCKWTDSSHSPCSSSFGKRDHLTSHLRIHVPLKPHPCAVCKRAFKRPQDLKKHEKLHSEEDFLELQTSVKRSAAVGSRMVKDAERKHESDTGSSSESGDSNDDNSAQKNSKPIRPTLTSSTTSSNKRRISDLDPSDLKVDRKFTNAGIECVKQFLVDVKRSKFCPSTVSSPQSDVDSNLSAHLDEISKYVSTFPSFLDMEPPLLPSPQSIPSSSFQQNNMSSLSLDVLTNQDLTNVDDFLNSLTTNLLDQVPFQKPSISPFMHGLRNEPMAATASNSYLQSYDNSFFMFQNPSSGDMVPFNSHQVYQPVAPKFNNTNNNNINAMAATQLNPSISSTPWIPSSQSAFFQYTPQQQQQPRLIPTIPSSSNPTPFRPLPSNLPMHHKFASLMQPTMQQQPAFSRVLQEGSKQYSSYDAGKRRDSDTSMHEFYMKSESNQYAENHLRNEEEWTEEKCDKQVLEQIAEQRLRAVYALKRLIHEEMETRVHQTLGFVASV